VRILLLSDVEQLLVERLEQGYRDTSLGAKATHVVRGKDGSRRDDECHDL